MEIRSSFRTTSWCGESQTAEDCLDDARLFDRSDELYAASATRTREDVDREDPTHEELRMARHRSVPVWFAVGADQRFELAHRCVMTRVQTLHPGELDRRFSRHVRSERHAGLRTVLLTRAQLSFFWVGGSTSVGGRGMG